jgi:hypothetical protein
MLLYEDRRTPKSARGHLPACVAVFMLAGLVPSSSGAQAVIGGCQVLPASNIWNRPIDESPVDPHSAEYLAAIGSAVRLQVDPSIPINVVGPEVAAQPLVKLAEADESDTGPVPIPENPRLESGGDAHMLVLQTGFCRLYELYAAKKQDSGWTAASAAFFDLHSNRLRPDGWTSTDAAGLPVMPGLLRYEEVKSGQIAHALRITVPHSQRAYVWPARHFASKSENHALPPMGLRMRLKREFVIGGFSPEARVVLLALQKYGAFIADNGRPFLLTATPDDWPASLIDELKRVTSNSFEAVDTSEMMVNPNSGRAGSEHQFSQVAVPYKARIALRIEDGNLFSIVLAGDAAVAPLEGAEPGKIVSFQICQDRKGGHRLSWPASVHGAMTVGLEAGKCSAQSFVATAEGLYATGPGVVNQ